MWKGLQQYSNLGQLACTDYVNFSECQDRLGWISWSKGSFDYLDVKLKVFKKDENNEFRLAQNFTMWEADFNQFIRLKNQLAVAVRDFSQEENLTPAQVKLLAKAWRSSSNLHTKLLKLLIDHTEIFALLCCAAMWRTQRFHVFKCDCLEEKRTKNNSINFFM